MNAKGGRLSFKMATYIVKHTECIDQMRSFQFRLQPVEIVWGVGVNVFVHIFFSSKLKHILLFSVHP